MRDDHSSFLQQECFADHSCWRCQRHTVYSLVGICISVSASVFESEGMHGSQQPHVAHIAPQLQQLCSAQSKGFAVDLELTDCHVTLQFVGSLAHGRTAALTLLAVLAALEMFEADQFLNYRDDDTDSLISHRRYNTAVAGSLHYYMSHHSSLHA